jgi:hypothetical protein
MERDSHLQLAAGAKHRLLLSSKQGGARMLQEISANSQHTDTQGKRGKKTHIDIAFQGTNSLYRTAIFGFSENGCINNMMQI